jgi:hypothetical protein
MGKLHKKEKTERVSKSQERRKGKKKKKKLFMGV